MGDYVRATETQRHRGTPIPHKGLRPLNGRGVWRIWYVSVSLCLCGLYVAGCAPKAPPAVAGAPAHPEFVFPASPEGAAAGQVNRIDRGWRFLQVGDVRNAEREFGAAIKQQPAFHPAETALGYVALARNNARDAAGRFDRALQADGEYVPALVGRGQAMLELDRAVDALLSFEAALAKDPSLTDLRSRIDVLRFRATQAELARAKSAADAGRFDEARTAYAQAIAASPDSAFLYRELAGVEQKAGQTRQALDHYRRAAEMDATDARSLAAVGQILDAQDDVVGALSAYERARAIDPAEVPDAVLARVRSRVALAKLPAEYRAIPSAQVVTRAEVAALIGNRLQAVVARARPRQVIITDIRGQWAEAWINAVVRAGIMEMLPNYEFDPAGRLRRGDLALIASRVLALVAADKPELGPKWAGAKVTVSDLSTSHLSFPAVSTVVAADVMPLRGGAFDLLRGVTGAEAVEVVGRLEALARP